MELKYISSVIKLELDQDKCIGCGMCVNVCPHNVFEMENKKAKIINKDLCMECGACRKNCPAMAIEENNGVGCAYAIINGMIKGKKATCGDDDEASSCGNNNKKKSSCGCG